MHNDPFRALLEAAPDAMVIVDRRGKIVYVNAQTEAIFGYSRSELIGASVDDLVPERLRGNHGTYRTQYADAPRVRQMGSGLELYARRKDGTEFPVEVSLSPIQTAHELLISSTIRDVTERATFEQALREKNAELERANLAKDNFLAAMSHELRTPLNAIMGFTGTLLMALPGPINAEQHRQLSVIQTSARHLLSLINDLLDIAKIRSGKVEITLEPTCLNDVIREVVESMNGIASDKSLELRTDLPGGAVVVPCDARALRQILTNLLSNALKYTEQGAINVSLQSHGEHAEIAVADTGVGIREDAIASLFSPFSQVDQSEQRRKEGAGLGLYLSAQLAQLLSGRLDVQSAFGVGSVFTLRLPRNTV